MCSYCWSTYSGSSSGSTWTSTRPVFVTSPHIIFMGIPLPLSPGYATSEED